MLLLIWLFVSAVLSGLVAIGVTAIVFARQPVPTCSVVGRVSVDWSAMPTEIAGREPLQLQSAVRRLTLPPINGDFAQGALAQSVVHRLGSDGFLLHSKVAVELNATSEEQRTVFALQVQGSDAAIVSRIADAYLQEIAARFKDIQFLEAFAETYANARDPQRSQLSQDGMNPDAALLFEMAMMFGSEPVRLELESTVDRSAEVGLAALILWIIVSIVIIGPLWIVGLGLWWLLRVPSSSRSWRASQVT